MPIAQSTTRNTTWSASRIQTIHCFAMPTCAASRGRKMTYTVQDSVKKNCRAAKYGPTRLRMTSSHGSSGFWPRQPLARDRARIQLDERTPIGHAAVNGDDRAGRVRRQIRGEQRHGSSNFLHGGGAAERETLFQFPPARGVAEAGLRRLLHQPDEPFGAHRPGVQPDAAHADACALAS